MVAMVLKVGKCCDEGKLQRGFETEASVGNGVGPCINHLSLFLRSSAS
jgi:hypothetical protein